MRKRWERWSKKSMETSQRLIVGGDGEICKTGELTIPAVVLIDRNLWRSQAQQSFIFKRGGRAGGGGHL
jgi:hypothetical protein